MNKLMKVERRRHIDLQTDPCAISEAEEGIDTRELDSEVASLKQLRVASENSPGGTMCDGASQNDLEMPSGKLVVLASKNKSAVNSGKRPEVASSVESPFCSVTIKLRSGFTKSCERKRKSDFPEKKCKSGKQRKAIQRTGKPSLSREIPSDERNIAPDKQVEEFPNMKAEKPKDDEEEANSDNEATVATKEKREVSKGEEKRDDTKAQKCPKVFASEEALTKHRSAGQGKGGLSCGICCKTFKTKSSLKAHTGRHRERTDVAGKICHVRFASANEVPAHLDTVHHVNNGGTCNFSGNHHGASAQFQCALCGRGFTDKDELEKHVKSTHTDNHDVETDPTAKASDFVLKTKEIRVQQITREDTEEKSTDFAEKLQDFDTENKEAEDPETGKTSKQKEKSTQMKKKSATDRGSKELKEQCHKCGKLFANKFLVRRHDEQVHAQKTFKCTKCSRGYGSEKMLLLHVKNAHEDARFPCPLCGKHVRSKFALEQHIARHTTTKSIVCADCGKTFKFTTDLEIHRKRMHGNVVLSMRCDLCEKTFRTKRSLDEHKIRAHNLAAPFTCALCGRGFVIPCKLDRHMATHTGDRPFQCGECGKTFAQKNYLTLHMDTHASEATFQCNICSKKFKTRKYLYNHMETHNTTKAKNYQCSKCSMNFRNNQLLKRHFAIHLNERRFKCERCGKGFNSSGSLHHHKKTHNDDQLAPLVDVKKF